MTHKNKKSIFRIILGLMFFALFISKCWTIYVEGLKIKPSDGLFFIVFGLAGIVHTMEGLGIPSKNYLKKQRVRKMNSLQKSVN